MLTTGRSTEANGDRRRWMFRHPGQKSAPVVDGMSNPQGGRSMHASEILFVGSGFRLFFILPGRKPLFTVQSQAPSVVRTFGMLRASRNAL
jgi:hypothetical protein